MIFGFLSLLLPVISECYRLPYSTEEFFDRLQKANTRPDELNWFARNRFRVFIQRPVFEMERQPGLINRWSFMPIGEGRVDEQNSIVRVAIKPHPLKTASVIILQTVALVLALVQDGRLLLIFLSLVPWLYLLVSTRYQASKYKEFFLAQGLSRKE